MPVGCWSHDRWFPEASRFHWSHTLLNFPRIKSSFSSRTSWSSNSSLSHFSHQHRILSCQTKEVRSHRIGLTGGSGLSGYRVKPRHPLSGPPIRNGSNAEQRPDSNRSWNPRVRVPLWVEEHLAKTKKHLLDRGPLPDKGKPVVKRGRKATGQISDLTAGLPEED